MNSRPQRSPFQIPTIPGFSRQPIKKSLQKMESQVSLIPKSSASQHAPVKIHSTENYKALTLDEKFCFALKVPLEQDVTCYWSFGLGDQVANQYLRFLIFRQQEYFIRGVPEQGVVNNIDINCDGMEGYYDRNGVVTSKVCSLKLSSISSNMDDASMKTYDLVYKQIQDQVWKIPSLVTQLKLRVSVGQQAVALSGELGQPLSVMFDIRHVGR